MPEKQCEVRHGDRSLGQLGQHLRSKIQKDRRGNMVIQRGIKQGSFEHEPVNDKCLLMTYIYDDNLYIFATSCI